MTPDDSLYQYLSQPAHENTPSIIDLLNQPPTPPPPKNNSTAISNIPSTLNQLSNPSFVNETIPDNSCPFISRLSTDARSQIYSYLLLNPILSKAECISPETDFGIKQKYELEPAVLRICKEVYGEASAVLYDLNTFYLVAMKSTRMLRLTLADFISGSALTRYWRENADIFRVAPASTLYLCKVRQWRVEVGWYGSPTQSDISLPVVSIRTHEEYEFTRSLPIDPRTGLPPVSGQRRTRNQYLLRLGTEEARTSTLENTLSFLRPLLEYSLVPFCHLVTLCEAPPHALEIIIRAKKDGETPVRSEYLGMVPTESEKLRLVIPLEMLRGVGSLQFTYGEKSSGNNIPTEENPNEDTTPPDEDANPDTTQNNIPPEISTYQLTHHSEIINLATSKTKILAVESPSNIYNHLLSYAQAFERYEPFKQHMGANWLYQNSYMGTPNPYKTKSPNPIQYSNPFGPQNNDYKSHPVNRHLSNTAAAVRRHDIAALRKNRKAVIDFLEPQYTRIMKQVKNCREFTEKQNQKFGMWMKVSILQNRILNHPRAVANSVLGQSSNLRPDERIKSIDFSEALVVLEEYADSFTRDIPHETRRQIALIRYEYHGHYEIMEREVAIHKLQNMVIDMPRPYDEAAVEFKRLYMLAANDMQRQFLEIRRARRQLVEDDIVRGRREFPVDFSMGLEDGEIDWCVSTDDTLGLPDSIFRDKRNAASWF
ncbi:hypothetical protein BCIN_08g06010 [Botrytis cinerea B05.10]|uniref:Uncharacterized protein n=1 Tax=Botryotinia fuckeliana (strain B05.10) TaxID=332648 RepID=A0A384JRG9_BOTFB|nr:hypothetical protein BCIN_08g06010 [Botrytis cinerea B05.10]ATZ52987.1 hypothetical protein BCIN_08g06010 [Botrytis cinerea B05.10]